MAAVTEERSVLVDAVEYEQSRQITNSGDADIEVSTDQFFRWGYGIRIGPGLTEPVVLHVRESLYAMCAPGESSTATLDGTPPDPAAPPAAFTHFTENTDHNRLETDWPVEAIAAFSRFSATGLDREGPTVEIQGGGDGTSAGLWIWKDWGDNAPVLWIDEDGVIRFGPSDGATDMRIYRDGPYSLSMSSVKDTNHGGFEWWNDEDEGEVYFYLFGGNGGGASIQFDTREGSSIVYASNRDGEYAALAVERPDGWRIDGADAALLFGPDGDVGIRRGDGELVVWDNDGTGFYVNFEDGPVDYATGKWVALFSDNPTVTLRNGADSASLSLNPASDLGILSTRGVHIGTGAGPDIDINGNGVNVVDDGDNGFYVSGSGGKTVGMNEGGVQMDGGWLQGVEIADPPAANPNSGRAYFKDIGGKTALVVRFPTGAVQQIAIEP